ncbi:hypothetical protein QJQ45_019452 [Haematococcus lacustris]|nr:hypothetical protein QJQ45_019452 [Haematococcus lacustris]
MRRLSKSSTPCVRHRLLCCSVVARRTLKEQQRERERKRQRSELVKKPGEPEEAGGSWLSDGTLLVGDVVMVVATEVSSERIPLEVLPQLAGVMAGSWVMAGLLMGDYKGTMPESENWYLNLLGPSFTAIINCCLTWSIAVTLALAVSSLCVANNILPSEPFFEDLATENLSPQLEVAVASLVTMCAWRGIAARLRF